jgi:hypothetical protein
MQKNPQTQKWSKAKDRFDMPKDRVLLPGPGNYSPKISMAKDSAIFKSNGTTIMGRNTLDILDFKYQIRERSQVPGPGSYGRHSDFGNTVV